MENINRNNYEVFFLDYFEGNLDAKRIDELFLFLSAHPDLENEFRRFEIITLSMFSEEYENKEDIRKLNFDDKINEFNYEQFCVAFYEGDLNNDQKNRLEKYIDSNPGKRNIFETYPLTRLQADSAIVFFGKKSLKKGGVFARTIIRKMAVAASFLIVVGISFFLITKEEIGQELIIADIVHMTEISGPAGEIGHPSSEESAILVSELPQNSIKPIERNLSVAYISPVDLNVEYERVDMLPISIQKPGLIKYEPTDLRLTSLNAWNESPYEMNEPRDLMANLRRGIDDIGLSIDSDGIDGSGRLTIWDIADAGINVFGRLTGADVRLDRKKDNDGNITALAFQSRNLNFTKKIDY